MIVLSHTHIMQLYYSLMDFQLEYISYRSQGKHGQLSQAQTTARVNSTLHRLSVAKYLSK